MLDDSKRLTLRVVDLNEKAWQLSGRSAILVTLIILHRERINSTIAGSVEFHMGPDGRVQLELRERMEAMRA